jgi:hypothetical protein
MLEILFWVYLLNCILLIVHEMDSAYWKEWELFGMKGDIGGFLLIHIPLLFLLLYGLVLNFQGKLAGLIISLIVGVSGIFAFFIHMYFIRKGRKEFNTIVSKSILFSTLIISIIQIGITIYLMLPK